MIMGIRQKNLQNDKGQFMKKIIRTAFFALFAAAFLGVSGGLFSFMSDDSEFVRADDTVSFIRPTDGEDEPEASAPVIKPVDSYVIREHNGKIAVFSEGNSQTPEIVLDVYVFTLPSGAADELLLGIYCDGTELYKYLDAYTS